ncbi:hypothetical protein AGMMS49975_22210 [Clostridia bacterium]|nr:hypothetical protein AGMMS49975_22210 [Clostridia bacterium]
MRFYIWNEIDAYRAEHNEAYKKEIEARRLAREEALAAQESKSDSSAEGHYDGDRSFAPETDASRLNDFLGQFKAASGAASPVTHVTSTIGTEFVIRSRPDESGESNPLVPTLIDINSDTSVNTSSDTSSEAMNRRNAEAVAENRMDDAAQAAQAEIADAENETLSPNEIGNTNDSTDNPWTQVLTGANSADTDSESINKRNAEAVA